MKRTAIVALLFAAFAQAGSQTVDTNVTVVSNTWTVANNLATNAALLTSTGVAPAGVPVRQGGWVAACVSAESTRTLTSGNLRSYAWMPVSDATTPPTYRWVRYPPLDWTLTGGGTSRDECSGDKLVGTGIGRFAWVEDDVAVSAGTTIVITYSMRSGEAKP